MDLRLGNGPEKTGRPRANPGREGWKGVTCDQGFSYWFLNFYNTIPLQSFHTEEASKSVPTLVGPHVKYIIYLRTETLSNLEATRNHLHLWVD